MTYDETLDYLFHALPAYHRIGAAAYKADLSNTEAMMDHLDHPEHGFRSIHVAGTNGKGSVSHFMASILHRCGLKVGLYTSPHLVDFRERIRINGEMIPKEFVVDYVEKHHDFFETQGLSFFEMTVGLAFEYFRNEKVDIAVIEVGMGGRLDSTNLITPLVSVITNIGFDHTQFLGDTLEKIAYEKAGIIKPGIPVVIGETQKETESVFLNKAAQCNSKIVFADKHFVVDEKESDNTILNADILRDGQPYLSDIHSPMAGSYQRKNIATVCAVCETLTSCSDIQIDASTIKDGIANVIKDTGLHGRWEKVGEDPLTVAETAHNADGISTLVEKIGSMKYNHLHIVYGCVSDKDFGKILNMLPDNASYYYTRPSVERGLDENILASTAEKLGKKGKVFKNVHSAVEYARKQANKDDLVIVTGSIFLVADFLNPNHL
ncbi:MAG: bifunctional folylpolyglutamate synthase/dihydrofolate synthase [Bacteroidales bacterium]|nr:bifunctional folylpolyglutamate synthase/dihydrofolate synthase [Bacteroidales bacterium]